MKVFSRIAAILLLSPLVACDTATLFRENPVPESPGVAEAPWPRLVDTPPAPAPGIYTDAVPDPAEGIATTAELGIAAREAAARAEALSEPVLTEAERRRLTRKR